MCTEHTAARPQSLLTHRVQRWISSPCVYFSCLGEFVLTACSVVNLYLSESANLHTFSNTKRVGNWVGFTHTHRILEVGVLYKYIFIYVRNSFIYLYKILKNLSDNSVTCSKLVKYATILLQYLYKDFYTVQDIDGNCPEFTNVNAQKNAYWQGGFIKMSLLWDIWKWIALIKYLLISTIPNLLPICHWKR